MQIGLFISQGMLQAYSLTESSENWVNRAIRLGFSRHGTAPGIRGNVVAAETLLEALLINQDLNDDYHLFVHPWKESAIRRKLSSMALAKAQQNRIHIRALTQFVHETHNQQALTAWLVPISNVSETEGVDTSHKLRQYYAPVPYPILTLTHGLSQHTLIYDFFLRFLTEESFSFDSIICSSSASCTTVRLILDELTRQAGTCNGSGWLYRGRVDRIPLCVNTELFQPAKNVTELRRALQLPEDVIVLLSIGRLSMMKSDLRPLLKVLSSIIQENACTQVLLVLAGTEDGGMSEHISGYAQSLGIRDNVRFMLNISEETKRLLIPAVDVFVSTGDSLEESFGLAPIEAMSCGVPQIVSDWSGYRDTVVHGKTGFLVPTYWKDCTQDLKATGSVLGAIHDHAIIGQSVVIDLLDLYKHLKTLITNKELRQSFGQQSRERVLAEFSYTNVARLYRALMEELNEVCRNSSNHQHRKSQNVSEAKYFSCFSHYASRVLQDTDRIRLHSSFGTQIATREWELLPGSLRAFDAIDREVLNGMLGLLYKDSDKYGATLIDALLYQAKVRWGLSRDSGTRHVLWLLKHGYIQLESGVDCP